jgi:hypothetical protein
MNDKMNGVLWERNDIQFVRLIVTLRNMGVLTTRVAHKLAEEYGVRATDVVKLIERAEAIWAEINKLTPLEAELKPNHLATTEYLDKTAEHLLNVLKARKGDTPVGMLGKESVRLAFYNVHGYEPD